MTVAPFYSTISPLITFITFSHLRDGFNFSRASLSFSRAPVHPHSHLSHSQFLRLFFLPSLIPTSKLISTPTVLPHRPSPSSAIALHLYWLHLSWPWRARCPLLSPNVGAATLAAGLDTLALCVVQVKEAHTQPGGGGVMHMHTGEGVCICVSLSVWAQRGTHTHTYTSGFKFATVTFLGVLPEYSYRRLKF